jgi:hypothetical protein
MGIFPSPPPTDQPLPDIPIPNYEGIGGQLGKGLAKARKDADFVHKLWFAFLDLAFFCIGFLMGGIDDIFARFIKAFTAAQATGQPGFLALMAAVIGDLLGIEYDEDELIQTMAKGGRVKTMSKAGGWLYDTLRKEFEPSGGTALQSASDAPAKTFLGFLIEFAIRQGNVAMWAEFLPEEINFFGGLREYGELLARNLGLGRLARQALRPLMQVMVADPLQWKLNQTYRPKLLSESQAVHAYHRGALTQEDATQILTYQGYRDRDINLLLTKDPHKWSEDQLYALWRSGAIAEAEIEGKLIAAGADPQDAVLMWQAYKLTQKQSMVDIELQQYLHLARQGLISVADLRNIIASTPLTQDEYEHYNHLAGIIAEYPRKHVTESEIERAFLGGIVDMSAVQQYWRDIGYFPDSIQLLSLLLLQKQSASNRTKPGHVPHKVLSEAQAEKAYQNGLINLAQLQAYWHAMGYSPDDQAVLSALVQLKTPGPGATTLPGLTTP